MRGKLIVKSTAAAQLQRRLQGEGGTRVFHLKIVRTRYQKLNVEKDNAAKLPDKRRKIPFKSRSFLLKKKVALAALN